MSTIFNNVSLVREGEETSVFRFVTEGYQRVFEASSIEELVEKTQRAVADAKNTASVKMSRANEMAKRRLDARVRTAKSIIRKTRKTADHQKALPGIIRKACFSRRGVVDDPRGGHALFEALPFHIRWQIVCREYSVFIPCPRRRRGAKSQSSKEAVTV